MPRRFELRVVNSSMNVTLGLQIRPRFSAGRTVVKNSLADRHETCLPLIFLEEDSHSRRESVEFQNHRAKAVADRQTISVTERRWPAVRVDAGRQAGWIHGAARNGNRKRTRVRVACGGGIRPPGLGRQPIYGHYGRSVVDREFHSPVVLLPACEANLRQRRISCGPGLLAALTPRDSLFARMSPYEHHEQRTAWATRPVGSTVTSAVSILKFPRNVRRLEETHTNQARARVCARAREHTVFPWRSLRSRFFAVRISGHRFPSLKPGLT